MSVITLSAVEGTSVLPLGLHLLQRESLLAVGHSQACRRWGSCVPAGRCGVMCCMAWHGRVCQLVCFGVPWHSLSSCHLPPARRYLSGSGQEAASVWQGFLECCRDEVTLQDLMGCS